MEEKTLKAHLLGLYEQAVTAGVMPSDLDGLDLPESLSEAEYPALVLSLEQAFYESYLRRPSPNFKGSVEERISVLCAAVREQAVAGPNGWTVTIYPDFLIACDPGSDPWRYYDDRGCDDYTYWKAPYTVDDANETVTFGEKVEVEIEMVFVEEGSAEDTDEAMEPVEQAATVKTDGGKQFSSSAYLIVPNPSLPSTWKVRVEETPGKVTAHQLGAAHAALTVGYRGRKLIATDADKSKALAKLKKLYKSNGLQWPGSAAKKQDANSPNDDIPDWLRQGGDPPGGDTFLTQSWTTQLQAVGYDADSGAMHVQGVATTANVMNAMQEVYPREVWDATMPRLKRLMKQNKLTGEAMHPAGGKTSLDRTCMKFTDLSWDGDSLKFQADILPTEPHGQNLIKLIRGGVAVDISSRGQGAVKQGDWNGLKGVKVVQQGFRCDGFDCVVAGASPGATITDWQMGQSADTQPEEDLDMEVLDKISAQMEQLIAKQNAQDERIASLTQGTPNPAADPASEVKQQETKVEAEHPEVLRAQKLADVMEQSLVKQRLQEMCTAASQKWATQWVNAYRMNLEKTQCTTLEALTAADERATELIASMVEAAPKFPSQGFVVQQDVGKRGFKNGNECLDALVADLPDEVPLNIMHMFQGRVDPETGKPITTSNFMTQRRQCRAQLENMARAQFDGWNGPAAMQGLVMLSQGYSPDIVAEHVLTQDCCSLAGSTSVANGGAPTAAIFLFMLIRQVFPLLFVNEIASIQPMVKPDGKIFFLSTNRLSSGGYTDASGATVSGQMPINRTDSLSDSYSNSGGECTTPNPITLKLSSLSVTAEAKKLRWCSTVEEKQDLRAYHGLDVEMELQGASAREIAMEWNEQVLARLLAGATAGNFTYGTTTPAGFTATEWEKYLSRYVDKAGNGVFKNRQGEITHLIGGPDAILKLGAAFHAGIVPRTGPVTETYSGLILAPFTSITIPQLKVYKSTFWSSVNTDKILVLRKGPEWSDTPYVWAPYLDYVSPVWTDPISLSMSQGIMSRVAHKVVNGDAIATVTINGTTGQQV